MTVRIGRYFKNDPHMMRIRFIFSLDPDLLERTVEKGQAALNKPKNPREGNSMKLSRRHLMLGAGGLAAIGALGVAAFRDKPRPRARFEKRKTRQPNILLIVTDQERHHDYLPAGLKLPNRERIFERATRFKMHGISGLCSMARANIYTGQHYQHNGVYENTPIPFAHDLYPSVPTIGTMMQDAGYETAYFGKWHLTHLPTTEEVGTGKMRALFQSYGFEVNDQAGEVEGPQAGYHKDPRTARVAASYLHEKAKAGKGERPWFAAVNLLNPHDIMFYLATQRQLDTFVSLPIGGTDLVPRPDDPLYAENLDLPLLENFGETGDVDKPLAHQLFRQVNDLALGEIPLDDAAGWKAYENYYFNCLRDVDRNLGTVLDAMDATDAWRDTVVIFTADHGELSGAHGLRAKGNVIYRENCEVPLAICHPDIGTESETGVLTSHVDIAPAILRFAGIEQAEWQEQLPGLRGHDLSQALGNGADRELGGIGRKGVLYQWDSRIYGSPEGVHLIADAFKAEGLSRAMKFYDAFVVEGLKYRHGMRGSFDGRYKFARYFRPTEHNTPGSMEELKRLNDLELYDTQADPLERVNIANNPENEAFVWQMAQLTNALVAGEVGEDDGQMLPGPSMIWNA
ncbi:MAG: sulfatase-like hydrolase/transferase [Rhizobiales bacterium]|nr:sulfatase-like hydrolase/transferase [Hyphomicrobiales bacterium]